MKKKTVFKVIFYSGLSLFIIGLITIFAIIMHYSKDLPDFEKLKDYKPPVMTRLYSNDGKLLGEYAKERRLFVPIEQIPDLVKNAFISAEDAAFYKHVGINPKAILSALIDNIKSKYYGINKVRGGSTITQQVAKNFLLTNEKTLDRKIKEAILSIRMDQNFTKDEILELYLNQIFLGNRSYGVASAALNYFNKSLDELTIEEAALLASLPKAPAKLDPTKGDQSDILDRRNWVLSRMNELGYITNEEYIKAVDTPIVLSEKNLEQISIGKAFDEEVRKEIVRKYGEDQLLEGGNVVITTLNPKLQAMADKYLKMGIENYDRRHGFRGAIDNLYTKDNFKNKWGELIDNYELKDKIRDEWQKAIVLEIDKENERVVIGLGQIDIDEEITENIEDNEFITISSDDKLLITGYIPLKNLTWAKEYINVNELGPDIKSVSDIKLNVGDVIVVQQDTKNKNEYLLKQIPTVNGALVAMNPHNGEILAMMGGYIDSQTDFNRATQAERQPGSIMKTFAYIAALENGYTPASIVMDEEIELDQGLNRPPYKPKNDEGTFFGPTTLRVALEKSRNVATVRLASDIGLSKVAEVIKRFGINKRPRRIYSIVLGSIESNLIKVVRAYSMIVNGGKEIQPTFIEKIQDREGKTIFATDKRECKNCKVDRDTNIEELVIPTIVDNRKEIIDSATAYQITNMLQGVVQRGTAWRAKAIKKPIGAKTGTTNDSNDAWFVGFTPDLVVGVYVGFDKPSTLGKDQTGSSVAAPIFVNFMINALKDVPSTPFRVPSTVNLIRIDTKTGYYPTPYSNNSDIVLEAFKEGDKIVKFEEEITDEDIEEFIYEQEQVEMMNRPIIINNIQLSIIEEDNLEENNNIDVNESIYNDESIVNEENIDGENNNEYNVEENIIEENIAEDDNIDNNIKLNEVVTQEIIE